MKSVILFQDTYVSLSPVYPLNLCSSVDEINLRGKLNTDSKGKVPMLNRKTAKEILI